MLIVHHLGKSQSERITWLCEELELPYEIKTYTRDAQTLLSPPELKQRHPIGSAPLLEDGAVFLAESGAIVEYILAKYGKGRLVPSVESADFAPYLYWFHYANGTLQPIMGRMMILSRLALPADHAVVQAMQGRLDRTLGLVETRLGDVPYLAGDALTAADIMNVFSLSTMRAFFPVDLGPYPHIRSYLARIGAREAYQRAMQKGDPGLVPLLT